MQDILYDSTRVPRNTRPLPSPGIGQRKSSLRLRDCDYHTVFVHRS